ncbi:MAG: dihydrodipicolinate synthase family protein, partial [Clostridia bacterium]|nr:dihydrodipicolinate synthase family protein [Clostridia bacterium]
GRGVLIDHVGAPDLTDALALARNARTSGVDAVSSLVPSFYFANTEDEIVDYYKRVAAEAEKPLLVYATPMITGDVVSLMERLLRIDGVIGCKFTRYNYYEMSLVKMLDGGNVNVINGPDEMLLAGLSMGADGGIGSTYNVMPDRFVALYDAFRANDLARAREIQYGINRVIRVLLRYGRGNAVKTVKEALALMGLPAGFAASPAAPLDEETRDSFRKDLIAAGLSLEP